MIVADTLRVLNGSGELKAFFPYRHRRHGINIERAAQKAGRYSQRQADYVVGYY